MRSRLPIALLFLVFPTIALLPVSAQPPCGVVPPGVSDLPFGSWDLRQLNGDPVFVVKATHDPKANEVKLLLEFQRSLTFKDIEWPGSGGQKVVVDRDGNPILLRNAQWLGLGSAPPFLVRFEDEDGVTLVSQSPRFEGDVVGIEGRRLRLIVALPRKDIDSERGIGARIKRVVIDKLYRQY
jgi:hypothetical protein